MINVWALILFLIAAVTFGIAAWLTKSLIALGLCFTAIGLIVAFGATGTVHL
jgi:hypothetical protein